MWLTVRIIDFENKDGRNGNVPEYDYLLNMGHIKAIRPNQNGTCMIMYLDPKQNVMVKHGLDYFSSYLVSIGSVPPVRRLPTHSPEHVAATLDVVPPVVEKKFFPPKGTTSWAINQG